MMMITPTAAEWFDLHPLLAPALLLREHHSSLRLMLPLRVELRYNEVHC